MTAIKSFGSVTTVLIGTARKAMTIALSFLLFPKAFSWYNVAGTALVLGGLLSAEVRKAVEKQRGKAAAAAGGGGAVEMETLLKQRGASGGV
jgi:adenosine 3'-phospho 5'-phosphosulfate transporter B3